MLETQITPYGTETPEQLMDKFYQAGNEMLLTLRNYITSPDKRKKISDVGCDRSCENGWSLRAYFQKTIGIR